MNWKGQPLVSVDVIINLIGNTTSQTGLNVYAMEDRNTYQTKRKITNDEMKKKPRAEGGTAKVELYHQAYENDINVQVISGQLLNWDTEKKLVSGLVAVRLRSVLPLL